MVARRVRASLARSGGSPTAWCGLALALGLAATGCDDRLAARLAEPPGRTPAGASRCQVTASQLRPLIAEWEAADRASLEVRLRREGLVAVRYAGCELEVLRCQAAGKYHYSGVTVKQDGLAIESEDDLYGSMPIGALRAQVELLTLFLAHTVIWTDVQVDADSVIGTYEYRPWEPDGNNRRKGLAIIKLRGDEAYYYLQETDQRYWDSVAGTFRASAATLRVDPPAGG